MAAAAVWVLAAPAADAKKPPRRIEVKIRSLSADAKKVKASYVSLLAPLPASAGPRPKGCDRIGYLRFRDARGPRKARKADAVFVTMPGIFAGAGSLDIFARNMVRTAHAHGRHVEVWTLDRRSNCLEDHYGVDQGKQRRNYRLAMNYYYHGAAIHGRKFGGFRSSQDAQFLKAVGLDQTVRDEYTVIKRGMPKKLRKRKVFCGGHSLGGPLTTAFAGWDFDGNAKTKRDAGYNQCAAFFALDTRLDGSTSGGGSGGGGGGGSVGLANFFAAASGGSPYVNAPPFTPETIQAVPLTALAAFIQPRAKSDVINLLPNDANFQITLRTLFSRNAENAATQMPSIRDFRTTNETALAATFDDNSSPVTILRTSLGTFAGGPVAQKEWPAPYNGELGSGPAAGLIDGKHLMIPIAPKGPLYTWWSYRKFGQPGTPVQKDDSGQPFTSGREEVTSIHQFARSIFESPADFAEQYFPLRLLADQQDAGNGDRSGSLENYRYNGIPKRAQFYGDAQHGIEEGSDPPPLKHRGNMWVKLPGYNHIDVATAALRQRGGKHELESARLWKFARKVIGPKRHHKHH